MSKPSKGILKIFIRIKALSSVQLISAKLVAANYYTTVFDVHKSASMWL